MHRHFPTIAKKRPKPFFGVLHPDSRFVQRFVPPWQPGEKRVPVQSRAGVRAVVAHVIGAVQLVEEKGPDARESAQSMLARDGV